MDIHNYERLFANAETLVRTSDLSARNKELIFCYRDACLLQQTCGRVRMIRTMGVLLLVGRRLGKDFDQATREDLQQVVTSLMARQPPYSPETLSTYKAVLSSGSTRTSRHRTTSRAARRRPRR